MPKAVAAVALTYLGYLFAWFVLLVGSALLLGQGSISQAERGVLLVLVGSLLLSVVTFALAALFVWRTAPAGAARVVLLVAFAGVLVATLIVQGFSTLVVFNR